jgi:hypothetical protein
VVLLVSQGKCNVKTKAMVASKLLPQDVVLHLIVYGSYGNNINADDDFNDDYYNHGYGSHYVKVDNDHTYEILLPKRKQIVKRMTNTISSLSSTLSWNEIDASTDTSTDASTDTSTDVDDDQISVSILYVSYQDGLGMY